MTALYEARRWETASRYYFAVLHRDLLGDVIVDRFWGGKGNRLGGAATEVFVSEDAARASLDALSRIRLARKYRETLAH